EQAAVAHFNRDVATRIPPLRGTRVVFDYMIHGPACAGVRARRALVATQIDRLAEQRPRPHVLSIAAGHLREASLSVAVRRRRTGRMLALDADPMSLEEVRASYGGLGVETETASFRHLLHKDRYREEFDFVYSTGLFDYLSLRSGRRLVQAMHRMVRPGGSFLIANFLPGIRDVGFMEAIMDWTLVYRSRQDMIDLTQDLPESGIKRLELWSEEALNILFLRITKP
ncbi:MAG TPA: class I SAM-dependent methyltransferase, partial [Polyangiaceae bacterium]|nr:class I SAM-dependent methyltransferase [Polyangiaceae bacterium]